MFSKHPAARESFIIFWLGLSSGLPILLVFGTLSIWLREAGVERATIGFLSWAALSYGFKFVWAPLVDSLRIPWLGERLGQRRSWMLVAQIMVIGCLVWMASWDPTDGHFELTMLALGAVMLAFWSATQDIVIDAYRIDFAPVDHQPLIAGVAVAGYRVGMILAGAGLLEVTTLLEPTDTYRYLVWSVGYLSMAALMLIGLTTTLLVREPVVNRAAIVSRETSDNLRLLAHFLLVACAFVAAFVFFGGLPWIMSASDNLIVGFLLQALRFSGSLACAFVFARLLSFTGLLPVERFDTIYIAPFRDFVSRYGKWALWLILVICSYRVADIVMGVMAKVFYTDMGYSKELIGRISFGFGLLVTIAGGVLGGVLALNWGLMRVFLLGAILSAASNLVFVYVASLPQPEPLALVAAIIVDNLSGGLAGAAAVAFLSSLVNRSFSATQYAAFTSMTVLLPKLFAGYSGAIVDATSYSLFFTLSALTGVPVVLLILWIWKPYNQLVRDK